MSIDLLPALILFAFVSSITPGPNNLMLMASGANFGFARSVPHMLGIGIGFAAMVALVGLGLAQIFVALPALHGVLSVGATGYLLWLAWRIATAAPVGDAKARGRPFSFWQAAAFQWVNPKAWTMALTATTVYSPDGAAMSALLIAAVFGAINLPSVSVWTVLGVQMARLLRAPAHLRAFNIAMAALLITSLYPVLRGAF